MVGQVWHADLVGAERVAATNGSQLRALLGAITLFRRHRDRPALITSEGTLRPVGLVAYALLSRITGRRNLVLVEFLPGRKRGLGGAVMERCYRLLLGRTCRAIQVMTAWERTAYIERYRFDPECVHHIPFYRYDERIAAEPVPAEQRHGVMSSGRNSCDWPTLIAAAHGQDWPLTLVCPSADRPAIEAAAAAAGVSIRTDLPRVEHDRLLAESRLLVVALRDQGGSSGHVRLASAASYATPVIASDIPGIQGYADLAVTTVPPGDPEALRRAVNAALAAPEALLRRESEVVEHARERPYAAYRDDIVAFLTGTSEPRNSGSTRRSTTT